MGPKRPASATLEADTPASKKTKGPASTLKPVGERTKAVKGEKNPELLHMLCIDTNTNKLKELHFKKLVHAQIDWDNAEHIAKINSWRNQLYGRAGFKSKDVCMWSYTEEDWLELYFHLIIVKGTSEGLMVPRPRDVLQDFNNFFRGHVFYSSHGEAQEPRQDRKHNAFVSKLNRVVLHLKPRLEYMMLGRAGDFYRPQITFAMIEKYGELKRALIDSGTMGQPFSWKVDYEAGDEWANNDGWRTFWEGLCRLPAMAEAELAQLDADLDAMDEGVVDPIDAALEGHDKLQTELKEHALKAESSSSQASTPRKDEPIVAEDSTAITQPDVTGKVEDDKISVDDKTEVAGQAQVAVQAHVATKSDAAQEADVAGKAHVVTELGAQNDAGAADRETKIVGAATAVNAVKSPDVVSTEAQAADALLALAAAY